MRERDDRHLSDLVDHAPGRGDPFAASIRVTLMPMVITDARQPDNPIVFVNDAFLGLTGYEREEVIGRNCRFLQGAKTDPAAARAIGEAVAAATSITIDILNYRKDGTSFWNALYISPVPGADESVEYFFASQLDVTDRVDAKRQVEEQKACVEAEVRARTAELQAALDAKTILLHEVDHRVKNNLTMIGALLRLQSRALPDPAMRLTLETMLERVDALATVHRRLYQSDDITRFDIGTFATMLARDIIGASGRGNIMLALANDKVTIASGKAAPVGLILNELITNAVKHGFADGRGGHLQLSTRCADGIVRLVLIDDGPGFDPDAPPGESIGRALVTRLSRQIRAETIWRSGATGTTVTVAFAADDGIAA